jgi:hypothetical protein
MATQELSLSTIRPWHGHVEVTEHKQELWTAIGDCRTCGLALLRLYVSSAQWVHRRVESVRFVDDRSAHRRVSVDFTVPKAPTIIRPDGGQYAIVPVTLMRRKTLVNFDLRSDDHRALPLPGLRENQTLTKAVVRAWALEALADHGQCERDEDTHRGLNDLVEGDQRRLSCAWERFTQAHEGPLKQLREDEPFRAVIERLTDSFFMFLFVQARPGTRLIVKWSYDERLSLRYRNSGYCPATGGCEATYTEVQSPLKGWHPAVWKAAIGWQPTVVRFPVPAAECCTSFHFAVEAPKGVMIESATLLAGRPNIDPEGELRWQQVDRMPVDHVTGSLPRVDLHVVDVPFGSLSRAQVKLRVDPRGWLSAMTAAAVATFGLLMAAAFRYHGTTKDQPVIAGTLIFTLTATVAAIMVQPDPHRMATRLLNAARYFAILTAGCAVVVGALFAFDAEGRGLRSWMGVMTGLSGIPVLVLVAALWQSYRTLSRDEGGSGHAQRAIEDSRWEQSRTRKAPAVEEPTNGTTSVFDYFTKKYRFDQPAVRVASSELSRHAFKWDRDFESTVSARMERGVNREVTLPS